MAKAKAAEPIRHNVARSGESGDRFQASEDDRLVLDVPGPVWVTIPPFEVLESIYGQRKKTTLHTPDGEQVLRGAYAVYARQFLHDFETVRGRLRKRAAEGEEFDTDMVQAEADAFEGPGGRTTPRAVSKDEAAQAAEQGLEAVLRLMRQKGIRLTD